VAKIIFLHGWSMNGNAFIRQKGPFKGHQIATPDLHGTYTGQVAGLVSSYSEKPLLAGWSMGVPLILSELESVQPHVSGLIFISGTPCFIARDDFPQGMRRAIALKLHSNLTKDFFVAWGNFTGLMTHAETINGDTLIELHRLFAGVKDSIDPGQALSDLDWLYQSDFRAQLRDINVPLMIISGLQDRICSPDASRYMAGKVLRSKLHLIDGAGHMPFFTRAEVVNSMIRDFADGC